MSDSVNWDAIQDMIRHWLCTPENGYLGSDYGYKERISSIVQRPFTDALAQEVIAKMRIDIPPLDGKIVSVFWEGYDNRLKVFVDSQSATFPIKQ